ncbi:PspA/IM30 family protein [Carboxylicivirga sp. M1479]|uniref:PspA/IM30 family protein n=1 Tax=Carboxylicivirga sp. M1479 TaxID=2594476 RepID=UPI001177469D|nr:PspA/IM30 family protein [Carboxylicivirga sp. M1479]TRX71202.1 PspA/IM30 family protein [Carboxylicivirga sp. M1479]
MNIFSRLFRIGTAEAHSAVDKLEDPIKMTEQGIRDLKSNLDDSLKALAEVKALTIRAKNDYESSRTHAGEYEKKAILLLKKAEKGELSAEDADRLATEALAKKEECLVHATQKQSEVARFEQNLGQLDSNIKKLRSQISAYENELKTLTARVKVSKATKSINKQMAQIDSSSTINMLEKMKEKVDQEEALSEAYGEIANESKTLDDEIDSALGGNKAEASESLAELKAKLGLDKEEE